MPRYRRIVILSYFLVFCGPGVWLPYFPLYLSWLGFRGWQIGVLIGMQPGLRWISAIAWAYVADRWRVRHRILVVTAAAGMLCFVPLFFVRHFGAVALVLAAIAILHGPLIPLLDATVMDHLHALGGDYGRLRLWGSVAFVCGAVVSAPLVHAWSPSVVPVLLWIPLLGMVPVFWRLPRSQLGHGEQFRAPWALLAPTLTAFLVTAFLLQVSSGAWSGFFAMHTAALGFSDTVPGFTWGLAVMAEVAMLFWGRRVLELMPPARLIVLVLMVTVLRWALTAVARREVSAVALQLGHAFSFSAFHLAALLLLSRLVPPQSSTSGQAMYGMVSFGLGGSVGLAVAGVLVDRVGTSGLFACEALIALSAFVPALRLLRLIERA